MTLLLFQAWHSKSDIDKLECMADRRIGVAGDADNSLYHKHFRKCIALA